PRRRSAVGTPARSHRPARALVVEPPADDRDGLFGSLLGELAVLLDRGASPDDALRGLAERAGATPAGEGTRQPASAGQWRDELRSVVADVVHEPDHRVDLRRL